MILIDHHEPQQIIELLQSQKVVRVIHLDVGDYVIGEICIERKNHHGLSLLISIRPALRPDSTAITSLPATVPFDRRAH